MPAQSNGAAPAGSRVSGTLSTNAWSTVIAVEYPPKVWGPVPNLSGLLYVNVEPFSQ